MLLHSSFNGPSCTSVVINVNSDERWAEETVCSLRFGEKLSGVQTSAVAAKATDVGASLSQLTAQLQQAKARLSELARLGQGDHIANDAPREGKAAMTSLREHIKTLEIREAEFKRLKAAMAEAKAGGGNVSEVGAKLAAAKAAYENIYGIVEMEKTIKGLWVPAT